MGADQVDDRAKNYANRNPVTSTATEIASGLVFPLGAIRSGASGLRTALKSGAAYGAGKSETDEDAPIADRLQDFATDVGTSAAMGGLGYGALRGAGRLGRMVFPKVSSKVSAPSFKQKLELLRKEGIPTNVGERLANPTVRQDANILSRSLGQSDAMEMRPDLLYSKLMKRANFEPQDIRTGDLSRDTVKRAAQRFEKGYDDALRGVTVKMPDISPNLRRIEAGYSQLLPHEQRAAITRIIDDFRNAVQTGRTITGRDYKRIYSQLGKQMARVAKGDRNYLAPVYGALQ